MEQPVTLLLVGELADPLVAPLQLAHDQGCRFRQVADVYAAAAALLRPGKARPAAVLVLVESLRGDELRFFDFLARQLSGLPAAATFGGDPGDRRLEACRRRGVTVLSADELAGWLAARRPAAADSVDPMEPPPAAPVAQAAQPQAPAQPVALPPPPPDPVAGVEVELDLPDELADLPDFDVTNAELAEPVEEDEDDLADLPDEAEFPPRPEANEYDEDDLPPDEDEEQADDDSAEEPAGDDNLAERVPLTPWSPVPRVERRRTPPVRPASQDAAPPPGPTSDDARPTEPPPASAEPAPQAKPGNGPVRHWEDGLLTPEELRALLQEPDDPAGSEGASR